MNKERTNTLVLLTTLVFLLLLLLLALTMLPARKTALSDEQATYCARVASGAWPDFHHSYAAECEGAFGPQKPFIPYTERK